MTSRIGLRAALLALVLLATTAGTAAAVPCDQILTDADGVQWATDLDGDIDAANRDAIDESGHLFYERNAAAYFESATTRRARSRTPTARSSSPSRRSAGCTSR